MIVYGRNPVHEALRGPRSVSQVWATSNAAREPWLTQAGVRVAVAPADQIAVRCGSEAHQGVCAEVSAYRYAEADQLLGVGQALILALDQVQDPQNLGAICRSAECAGAAGVVLTERRSAEVTAAVCKASAGAVEHLRVARVRNLTDFLTAAKAGGFWCYGADAGAELDYRRVDFAGPVVLVMGSEGSGLRPRVAAACDALVSLPLRGRIGSLGVGAGAAVMLYAAAAARDRPPLDSGF
ncbi:MAG: 23S rRNA (guanosine(2251)-2'-O)-methyltransferase RlmB [Solirubrobacteraceae bacterium]